MFGGVMILLLLIGGAAATFPPETFAAAATAKFQIKPQTYEVVFSVGGRYVVHINDKNGDRLRLNKTKFDVMVMHVVNNGYVFKSLKFRDLLCINWSKSFKMLSYPSTPNLPGDCVVQMERVGVAVGFKSELEYERVDDKLCVKKSDIEASSKYRLFVQQGLVKYYLKVATNLLSTTDSSKASEFTIQYTRCREEREVGNFVCRILYRNGAKCREEDDFVREHFLWKRQVEGGLTTTSSSSTSTSTTTTTTTITTTTTPAPDLVFVSPVSEEEEDNLLLVDNISSIGDDDVSEDTSNTNFWCDYVDVFCSNSANKLNHNFFYILLLFIFFFEQ